MKIFLSIVFYVFGTIAIWYQSNILMQSTQGIILSMFATSAVFFFYLFVNTVKVYKNDRNLTNLNSLIMYGYAVFGYTLYSGLYLYNTDDFIVKTFDYINLGLIFISMLLVYVLYNKKTLNRFLPSIVKVIPQLLFAIAILVEGNEGVSEILIISFHFITLPRLFYNYIVLRENKTIENKLMLISELLNEASWVFVTIAYYYVGLWKKFHSFSFLVIFTGIVKFKNLENNTGKNKNINIIFNIKFIY